MRKSGGLPRTRDRDTGDCAQSETEEAAGKSLQVPLLDFIRDSNGFTSHSRFVTA